MDPRRCVELFHLLFLRVLTAGPDRAHYCVKGGCNLRFWFRSVRYSEDLDLDVEITARDTLKKKVDRLLAAGPLPALLRAQGLAVASFSAPKQTDTTQRWKVAISAPGSGATLPTKIEFSRRGIAGAHAYEPVDAAIARLHRISAPMASHYGAPAALAQKIAALAHRSETQARDVFDAHLLLVAGAADGLGAGETRPKEVRSAIERAMSVSYDEFVGQVIAYLEPEHRELHASREAWNQMQSEVVDRLEALA